MKCSKCGIQTDLQKAGNVMHKGKRYQYYICRSCNTEKLKKYRQTPAGKDATRRAVKKYESAHPKRRPAWQKAQKLEAKPCEVCGEIGTHRHHPDINQPMVIQYLCPLHHKQAHKL